MYRHRQIATRFLVAMDAALVVTGLTPGRVYYYELTNLVRAVDAPRAWRST